MDEMSFFRKPDYVYKKRTTGGKDITNNETVCDGSESTIEADTAKSQNDKLR